MAIIFMDSFSHYSTAQITNKWSLNYSCAISPSGGKRQGAMSIPRNNAKVVKNLGVSYSALNLGFAYNCSTLGNGSTYSTIASFVNGSAVQVGIKQDGTGKIQVTRGATALGTGTAVLSINTWYYIELSVVFSNTVGSVLLKVDGVEQVNLTGIDTVNSGAETANALWIGEDGNGSAPSLYADLYLTDSTGAAPLNGLLGEIRIDCYLPTADGSESDFTPNSGANNYNRVNQSVPDGDATYVSSPSVGATDLYEFAPITHDPSSIFAAQLNIFARKDDVGALSVVGAVKSGASIYESGTLGLADGSYKMLSTIVPLNPDGAVAWDKAAVNAAEFGQRLS